jgi:hypothetical protein
MTATQATTRGRRPDQSPTRTGAEFAVTDLMFATVRGRFGAVAGTVLVARNHLGAPFGLLFVQRASQRKTQSCRTRGAGIGSRVRC